MAYEGVGHQMCLVDTGFRSSRVQVVPPGSPARTSQGSWGVIGMAGAWLPGVAHVQAMVDGGTLTGGAPRVVWHTSESDPRQVSAALASHRLNDIDAPVHLVWNPLTGEITQMLPATRAGLGLGAAGANPVYDREGRLCLQIQVVGFAEYPFTEGPMHSLTPILRWLDSWGVPRYWPAGTPPEQPAPPVGERARARWCRGGHFGHSQVPESTNIDPGPVDIVKLMM